MTKPHGRIWRFLTMLLILILAGLIAYLGVIGMLVWKVNHVPSAESYDAIVVLGAQVKEDGTLSLQLQWRLDAAYDAWERNNVMIVTCGAQGSNEPAPEALVMRDYLVGRGVPEEMILTEAESFNTRQNIRHAVQLLSEHDVHTVLLVTSDYHLPRAMALAEDEGLNATGLGAQTLPQYWLKNYGREALAWIKYWGEKYLHLTLG
ncbi:MAG: YdcF family protein [Aristaeellaceae bacterium]